MEDQLLEDFRGNNVLIIGDVMIDKYLTGSIERISPEAPVPIVNLHARDERLGGAANVALSIKALDANPLLFAVTGDDENANSISNLLEKRNISSQYLFKTSKRKTTVKSRILASNQQILRVDEEDTFDLQEDVENDFLEAIKSCLEQNKIDVIIFQDYNKGVLTEKVISQVINWSNEKGIPTVVDPKRKNFWAYKEVTCFKPNMKEIREATNVNFSVDIENLTKAHQTLQSKLSNKITLITLSEHGIYCSSETTNTIFPTETRKIADVCGAGDAVISIVSLCIANGYDQEKMCILANIAGGQVCEKVGVVPLEKIELCQEYANKP